MNNQFDSLTIGDQHFSLALRCAEKSWQDRLPRPYFDPAIFVTRGTAGETVSRYGDDRWDFRAYSKDAISAQTLHFWRAPQPATDLLPEKIYEQHKALIWVIFDRSNLKTFNSLKKYNLTAHHYCAAAYAKGIDLFTLLTDHEEVGMICDEMNINGLSGTKGLVQALWRYRGELLPSGVRVQREKIFGKIKTAQAKLPEGKQTPLIPSRIYCSILAGLILGLDTIERDLTSLLDALQDSLKATVAIKTGLPGVTREQLKLARGRILIRTGEQMESLGWKKGPGKTLHTFILGKITAYQTHLMHTVVAFSGMRLGEVKILPLNGVLGTFQHRGQTHYLIKGYTHKLHNGIKTATEWVTIDQVHRAIELATRIAEIIASLHNVEPHKGQEALLFPSSSNPFKMMENSPFRKSQRQLIEAICPEVTTEDLDELNRLELDRGWARNDIQFGKRWPLAMHQLRRSLSVYAHRSGMVSLPALKAQLQHLTDEMRAYYADGWSNAVNLVFEKDHFSHEWRAAKAESSYFGLIGALQIAFGEEDDLLGRGAQRMELIVSARSRRQTFEMIKNGTISYRETVLGGCVSNEECKAMPLDPINFECIESNCVNAVVRIKRLDMVIRSQENVVAQLDRDAGGSVEQRLESEHLKRMLLAREKLRQAKTEQEATA